jgi:hypothetical protein
MHDYYGEGCKDFDFIIPADTAQSLGNGKLIAKVRDGRLLILFQSDESGTARASSAGQTLRFGLKLLNPYFSNFTDFNFNPYTPLYRNSTNPNTLDAAIKMVLTGKVFSHTLTDTARPATVTLQDASGQILQTDTITTANNHSSVSYDLTGQPAGAYTVTESYPETTKAIAYYLDTELRWQGIFGFVEIKVDNSFYTTAPEFEIRFAAKKETLKYYLVAKNYKDADFNQLIVVDKGYTEDGRPQVNFIKVVSSDFTADDISPEMFGNNGVKVMLFKSQEKLARQEKARKNIQINKNGEELIKNLPQPSTNMAKADLIIQISNP